MRKRNVLVAAAVAVVLAAGGAGAAAASGASASAGVQASPVTRTTTLPGSADTWAVPPAGVSPALTAQQAWDDFAGQAGLSTDLSGTTVQLGSLTQLVGPDCGAECENDNIVSGGNVYSALDELAYGYYQSDCPAGSSLPATSCENWMFVDANTGRFISGLDGRAGPAYELPPGPGPASPGVSSSG